MGSCTKLEILNNSSQLYSWFNMLTRFNNAMHGINVNLEEVFKQKTRELGKRVKEVFDKNFQEIMKIQGNQ